MAPIEEEFAGQVVNSLWTAFKEAFTYVYNYQNNINALQEADRQLVAKMKDEGNFSGETSRRVRDVSDTVANWRSDAAALHQEAEKLIQQNNISWLEPWPRYSTSRHASELTREIEEKVKAHDFGTSFDHQVAEGARFNLRDNMESESRRRVMDEALEALREGSVRMCSICGTGGTVMAKKIVRIVEAEGLLGKVAMVAVTENPNFEDIQNGIMESLGLEIKERTMQGRAKKLNHWLSNNKTLLVLDDVWKELETDDFDDIGIPLETNVCKILITSRNLDACRKMGSSLNICLDDSE